jgi:hypothetical protein
VDENSKNSKEDLTQLRCGRVSRKVRSLNKKIAPEKSPLKKDPLIFTRAPGFFGPLRKTPSG